MIENKNETHQQIAEHVCKRLTQLETYHTQWKTLWRDTAEYCLPREERDIYKDTTRGDKRENKLFDSTGEIFSIELASFLFSMILDPNTKFFELTTGRTFLDEKRDVAIWLQDSAKIIRETLANSNFSKMVFETLIDLVVYGTGPFRIEKDPETVLRFTSYPIFQMKIDQDQFGEVDTSYREFSFTAKQMIEKFPNRFNDEEKRELFDGQATKEFNIIHAVEKREIFYGKDSKGLLPYVSYFVLKEGKLLLNDPLEGFKKFPFAIPRFYKTSYETYGRSPAQSALSNLRSLNVLKRTLLQGVQLLVAPPLQAVDSSLIRPLRFRPFSVNYRRPGSEKVEPLITNPRVDLNSEVMMQLRDEISQSFFLDKIRATDKTHLTQGQVFNLQDQQMKALGAILARFHTELLKPVIEISFGILEESNLLPPAPDALQNNSKIQIRFTSQIARAQQLNEVQSLQQAIGSLGPVLQIKPEAADLLNGDESARIIFDALGVDKRALNDTETVMGIRDARQDAALEQQEASEAEGIVNAVSKLGLT